MLGFLRWQIAVAVVGIVAVAGILFAFSQSSATTTETVPDVGGMYVEAVVGNPTSMNPIYSQFNEVDKDLTSLIFSGLTKPNDKYQMVPSLAKDWQISADGRVYVFHLRPDVKWHDGQSFTADDVVFTVKAIQDPDFQGSADFAALWKNVSVERMDPLTVKFTLKEPYAPFLIYTSVGVLPAHILADVPPKELPNHSFRVSPVGTGMYKMSEASVEYVVLQRNEDYYAEKPYLSKIKLRFYANTQEAIKGLSQKDVQGIAYVPPDDIAKVETNLEVSLYRSHRTISSILYLNDNATFFKDKLVRQALAYAIDRDKIIDMVLQNQAIKAEGPILPEVWAFDSTVLKYTTDLERANALLDQAGWKMGTAGVREKDGQKFVFSLMTNDDKTRVRTAEELSRQLKKVGVRGEISASGYSGLLQNFLIPRKFDAILFGWDNGYDPDGYGSWHSTQAKNDGFNFSSFSNKRVDTILEQARQTTDEAERTKLYGEFQSIFAEEMPSIFLYYPDYTYVIDKSVKGVRLGLLYEPSARFDNIAEWYIKVKTVRSTAVPAKR